ncbi:hypothetical protein PG991_003565 [Apiospora marii]|uniref:Uncharacterized protein n=1 Tax=Apiospora marii TaxID=335849 RepID=A0ABR1S3Q6_9PEZI
MQEKPSRAKQSPDSRGGAGKPSIRARTALRCPSGDPSTETGGSVAEAMLDEGPINLSTVPPNDYWDADEIADPLEGESLAFRRLRALDRLPK